MSSAAYALKLNGRVAQPPQKTNVAEHKQVWQARPAITPEAEQELAREAAREAALVNAVKQGNLAAFEPLIEAHQTRVFQLAYRMLGNEQEAQDAAQDVFLQALTRIQSFDARYRFKSWVMAIANNACIDRLRRRRIEPSDFADHVPADEPDAEFDVMSNDPQPDVVAAQRERQRTVMALLKQLSPEDRAMITMFYWGDMSYEEIASSTRNTVSAVKSRLFRARRALAELPLAARLMADG